MKDNNKTIFKSLLANIFLLVGVSFWMTPWTFAEELELEAIYDEADAKEQYSDSIESQNNSVRRNSREKKRWTQQEDNDLFYDIAVISKKYLPRTKRGEITAQGTFSTNNQFFNNFGVILHLGWYLTEAWGIEASHSELFSFEKGITSSLSEQGIQTIGLALTSRYSLLSIKWTPIYGKISLFEKNLVHFDLFFKGGAGVSTAILNEDSGDETDRTIIKETSANNLTWHLGTGQNYAISKSLALRWDLGFNHFNPSLDGTKTKKSDLFLSLGLSFFFPEVSYR